MATPLQASNYPILLSSDAGTTYKTLVCIKDWHVPVSTATTDTPTMCGTFVGLGDITFNPSGTAILDSAPSGTQVTYEDMLAWQMSKTLLKFKVADPASGGSAGTIFYLNGDCYVTETDVTFNNGTLVEFSWTLKSSGILDNTP